MMRHVLLAALLAALSGRVLGEADAYPPFNKLCAEHFGAEREPEVYRAFGRELKPVEGSRWQHVSEASACFAWQTNLPARTSIEYGTTAAYGQRTPEPERHFSLHLHHLKGLKPGTAYHYRLVAVDERGGRLASPDATFTTRRVADAVRIPDDVQGPPYVLDKAGATYLVTRDIAAPGTAIFIAASGITLDLGGHTITYDAQRDTANGGACGVRGHKTRGIGLERVRVVNGSVAQGAGQSSTQKIWDTLYNPIFFKNAAQLELAGLTVGYGGGQVVAIALIMGAQRAAVHHNVFRDRGSSLFNRHLGTDAIAFGASRSALHHNLIARTRHRGIKASPGNEIRDNEIYVDSFATNSYGIMYYSPRGASGLRIRGNRIFGTGYHPVGIGSGQGYSDVTIEGNYIEVTGAPPQGRWRGGQGGGDAPSQLHPVNGIRLQKPGRNIVHRGNVIVAKGRGAGAMMRGLWLVPGDDSGPGLEFRDNRVKLIALDERAEGCAVSAGGGRNPSPDATVVLAGNTVISNLCHVQFGDNYSHGGRYTFQGNTFIRTGDHARYRTIQLGWRGWKYETYGHTFADTAFEGGAGYDRAAFEGTRRGRYDFAVAWTLQLTAPAGAAVTIKDKTGAGVFSARAAEGATLAVPLVHYVRTREGRALHTPHTVTVAKDGKTATRQVTMDGRKSLDVAF